MTDVYQSVTNDSLTIVNDADWAGARAPGKTPNPFAVQTAPRIKIPSLPSNPLLTSHRPRVALVLASLIANGYLKV